MNSATPSLCSLRPTPQALNAFAVQSSSGSPPRVRSIQTTSLMAGAALVVLELARQLGGEARRQEPRAVGHELGRRGRNGVPVRAGAPRGGHARDHDGRQRDDPHPAGQCVAMADLASDI